MANLALLWGGAAVAGLALLSARGGTSEDREPKAPPATKPPGKPEKSRPYYNPSAAESAPPGAPERPWIAPYLTGDPDQTDDVTALARMLASETGEEGERVVIGWITVQRARRAGWSLYRFITRGQGYGAGPQKRPGVHASTVKPPTPATLALARDLLIGTLQPSTAIREVKPGSWMERGQGPADQSLVTLQGKWQEGAWARLSSEGRLTKWVLYSADKPVQQLQAGQTAAGLLDGLPAIEALDASSHLEARPPLVA